MSEALARAGVAVKAGTAAELAARRVGQLLRFEDPVGHTLEVFCGAALEHRPVSQPVREPLRHRRHGTGARRAPGLRRATPRCGFYTEVLGFRLRDSMRMPAEFFGGPPGGPPVWLRFLGCNPRHHSLALAPMPGGGRDRAPDDRGRLARRRRPGAGPVRPARGAGVSATLGRHANDLMVSFYVRTPGGFDVEYGTDGRRVDDATWVSRETTAVSLWGHSFAAPGAP